MTSDMVGAHAHALPLGKLGSRFAGEPLRFVEPRVGSTDDFFTRRQPVWEEGLKELVPTDASLARGGRRTSPWNRTRCLNRL